MDIELILAYLKKILPASEIQETSSCYIMPTICHNLDYREASNKLYLYKNLDKDNPLFHCYTQCNDTFNIYQLIQKREKLEGRECDFSAAYRILNGREYSRKPGERVKDLREIEVPKFQDPLLVSLPPYSRGILDVFPAPNYEHPWQLEGIDLTVLEKFNISYSKSYEGVIIPHLDWRGNLVGIRIRTYNPIKMVNAKYMPLSANGLYYRHPLSMNFYGLYENQKNIRRYKRAYIFEAEKSVLISESIFNNNLSLAICGKSLSKWHIDMLVHYLKVEEVIFGFDKEVDYLEEFNRQKAEFEPLKNYMKVGIMVDTKNVFKPKESPLDRTREDFHSMQIWYI